MNIFINIRDKIGMDIIGVYLIGMDIIGMDIIGVYLIGMDIIGVYLIGVYNRSEKKTFQCS